MEMPKPLEYCLGHILGTCPNCSYDSIKNPQCSAYREGHLYVTESEREEMIEGLRPKTLDDLQGEEDIFGV